MKLPANSAEEEGRDVEIARARCGRILPPYAVSYVLRVTNIDRQAPEKWLTEPRSTTLVQPVPVNGRLHFPIPAGFHVAVDVEGYYVLAGTPVSPVSAAAAPPAVSAESVSPSAANGAPRVFTPQPLDNYFSSSGDLRTDAGGGYTSSGVSAIAHASTPWVTVQSGAASGGFAIQKSPTVPLVTFQSSNGEIKLEPTTYLNGRSDYFGTWPDENIFTGTVHDVTVNNPQDTYEPNRVTFYNAHSNNETHVPTTKFMAYTSGQSTQWNINYESQFYYHTPNQYHFRAYSLGDVAGGKETFWVKAATSGDSITQTRADMYVSGKVGIGDPAPFSLFANTANNIAGSDAYGAGPSAILWRASQAGYLFLLRNDDTGTAGRNGALLSVAATDVNSTALSVESGSVSRMVVRADGWVGIGTRTQTPGAKLDVAGDIAVAGNINAKYQDIAEWVPAAAAMEPGTVVILNPAVANEVMPSKHAYDTSVAGVVSARPGLSLGEASAAKAPIATSGRVRVRVDASRAPIHIGDLLVTGDSPGTAMRSEPIDVGGLKLHRPGTLVGKALEPLDSGQGEILVLLSLQ